MSTQYSACSATSHTGLSPMAQRASRITSTGAFTAARRLPHRRAIASFSYRRLVAPIDRRQAPVGIQRDARYVTARVGCEKDDRPGHFARRRPAPERGARRERLVPCGVVANDLVD